MMNLTWRCGLAFSLALVMALAAGCNNGGEVALPDTRKVSDNSAGGDSKAPPPTETISETIYPELPMQLLNPNERQTLVEVTKAQLCPCPKATDSMHVCLQKTETQCGLATSATLVAMQKIKEGYSQADVLTAVGAYIESAYKTYTFNLEGVPHRGNPEAPVVVVEFADFECPFCNQARAILKAVEQAHGDKVVIYFMQFPLSSHVHAASAARATLAAHKQGKFWPMYDLIFDNQRSLSDDKIKELANALGLNMEQFVKDWQDPALAQVVEDQKKAGEEASVDATPSFFINGRKFLGDKSPDGLVAGVAEALEQGGR